MFRYTATFLLIFVVLNHEFAAARRAEFVPETPNVQIQRSYEFEEKLEGRLALNN